MKEVVEILHNNNIICKSLKELKYKGRKKIKFFLGVNLKNEYCLVIFNLKKSKILSKDIESLIEIINSLNLEINFKYKKIYLILNSLICSKAKNLIQDWRIIDGSS